MIVIDEKRGILKSPNNFVDLFKDIEYLFECSLGKSEISQLLNAALATEIEIDGDAVLREHAKHLTEDGNGRYL